MWPILLVVLTFLAFGLPLAPAYVEWRRRRDISPLAIDGELTLDVRAVATEFRAMLDANPGDMARAGALRDDVLEVGADWVPTSSEMARKRCDRVLLAQGDLELPDNFTFTRDLYAKRNVHSGEWNRLRVVVAEGGLVLREGSVLDHWAHARSAHVAANCSLIGPLAALQGVVVEEGCKFTSLAGSTIRFGNPDHHKDATVNGQRRPVLEPRERTGAGPSADLGRRIMEHDYYLPPDIRYDGDLIVHGNLKIGSGTRIAGSVKATGSIRVGARVRIDGTLVCGTALYVAPCCAIMGPVAAEESASIAENCLIGLLSRPTSLAAPEVYVWSGTTVHGAVSAIAGGRVMPATTASPSDEHE